MSESVDAFGRGCDSMTRACISACGLVRRGNWDIDRMERWLNSCLSESKTEALDFVEEVKRIHTSNTMTNHTSPLTSHDIIGMAQSGSPIPPVRALATFANTDNWIQLYEGRTMQAGYQPKECEWAFIGPVRPPYELAKNALAGRI